LKLKANLTNVQTIQVSATERTWLQMSACQQLSINNHFMGCLKN